MFPTQSPPPPHESPPSSIISSSAVLARVHLRNILITFVSGSCWRLNNLLKMPLWAAQICLKNVHNLISEQIIYISIKRPQIFMLHVESVYIKEVAARPNNNNTITTERRTVPIMGIHQTPVLSETSHCCSSHHNEIGSFKLWLERVNKALKWWKQLTESFLMRR